jgi:MinD superfamily P-loop ATPase
MFNLLEGVGTNIVSSGYVAEVGPDCIGCGDCLDTCHFNAITIDEDEQTALVNEAICMGCGVCEDMCSTGVITLRREPSKGDPLDLEALLSER